LAITEPAPMIAALIAIFFEFFDSLDFNSPGILTSNPYPLAFLSINSGDLERRYAPPPRRLPLFMVSR